MAQVNRATFAGGLPVALNDNGSGDITPADLRQVFTDLADSTLWLGEAARTVNGRSGVDITLTADDLADGTVRVMMTASERSKLSGIEALATADMSGAEIVAAIDAQLGGPGWQGGGALVDGDYGDITVASGVWTVEAGVITVDKIAAGSKAGAGLQLLTTDGGLVEGEIMVAGADGRAVAATTATAATIATKAVPVSADRTLGFDSENSSAVVQYTFTDVATLLGGILSLDAARIATGTLANARIGQDSVTQHAAAVATAANAVRSLVAGITGADAVTNIVSLTQAEYDAIGTPDVSTLYVIVG